MNLQSRQHLGVTVITVEDQRIDAAAAIKFKDAMRALTDKTESDIVLNLENVTFIDSSGLGAIVAAMKQLGDARQMALAALTPNVDKVFRLTRMDSIFKIHDSADDAGLRATG